MVVEEVIATMNNKRNMYEYESNYSLVLYSYSSILIAPLSPFPNFPTATSSHLKTL